MQYTPNIPVVFFGNKIDLLTQLQLTKNVLYEFLYLSLISTDISSMNKDACTSNVVQKLNMV
jgi:hypothetical protein